MFSDSALYTNIVDYYTVCGHVEGMLDRDQRTAKLRCYTYTNSAMYTVFQSLNYQIKLINNNLNCSSNTNRSHKRKQFITTRNRKSSYLWNTLRRLKQVLIAGIYLLSLISIPCSLSAPTRSRSNMSNRYESTPKWLDPSDLKSNNGDVNTQIPRLPDNQLVTQIVRQATIALVKAEQFTDEFAQVNFGLSPQQLHENWKSNDFKDWLPTQEQIPKSLNETVSDEHLQSLKLDTSLLDVYHYLQMIAVGLEQVVWDQEDENSQFLQRFNESQYNLLLVLSEIQMAIYERGEYEQMKPDITRDWMPDYLRSVSDTTKRKMRDWIIYRDYMNALQYVIQAFGYFSTIL